MSRWIVGGTAYAWLVLGVLAGACSSSSSGGGSNDGGATHDGSMPGDSSMGNDTGGGDTGPTDGGGSNDTATDTATGSDADAGMSPDGDAATDAPVLGPSATVALPGSPQQLAFDTTTNWLYVMLATGSSQGQIVAVDTTSNTVQWTLTNADAGTGNFGFNVIAVDSTANVVYAGSDATIFAYDGTSNALKATIDVSGVTTDHYVYGLAVDEAAQKLYALLGYVNGPQTVAVIDTSTTTPTVGPTVALADLFQDYSPGVNGLALDTQNHLLFACGLSSGTGNPPAADAIDTTTNTETGTPQVFAGASVGCKAGPGTAAMVTGASGATSAQIHLLEPASVDLPPNFQPTSFDTWTAGGGTGPNNVISVYGIDGVTGRAVFDTYRFCGETFNSEVGAGTFDSEVSRSSLGMAFSNAQDIWFTEVPQVDGGVASSFVYKLHIDQTYLPPPLDGGCL